uniref:Fibronectin type-III domain-containing protein n=1 Tax=Salvator merianae TaxID=96440 RepID=A0A8D0CBZ1_SALMN
MGQENSISCLSVSGENRVPGLTSLRERQDQCHLLLMSITVFSSYFFTVQLKPPCDVQLKTTSEPSYNLTWKICTVSHYLEDTLWYEVLLRINDAKGTYQILQNMQDQKWMRIENLSPDTVYEAAVRAKLQKDDCYECIWSNWSIPVTWRTGPDGKLLKIHLPNPTEFFPSLTSDYEGDVQKWLSSSLSQACFHITTATPDISVLEIMPKGHQEYCALLSKETFTHPDSLETSGHSTSSCFTNRGYFFFHHLDSLEIEPCKVYFTYDPVADESRSSSEEDDAGSYKVLHEIGDNQAFSDYDILANQNDSFLEGMKDPNQKPGKCSETLASWESFSVTSAVEQGNNEDTNEPAVEPTTSSEQYSKVFSDIQEQPGGSTEGTESCRRLNTSTSLAEDRKFAFLQSAMVQNPAQANHLSRTASSSLMPSSSEAYLSLRDLQSHISHHSF